MLLHGNTKAPQKSFKRSTDDASGGLTAASTALQCSPRRLSIATPSAASDASLQLCALQCITSGERRSIATPSAASGASVQLRALQCITSGERRSIATLPAASDAPLQLRRRRAALHCSSACCTASPAASGARLYSGLRAALQHRRRAAQLRPSCCVPTQAPPRVALQRRQHRRVVGSQHLQHPSQRQGRRYCVTAPVCGS